MSTNPRHQFTNDLPASHLQLKEAEPSELPEGFAVLQDIWTGALPWREVPMFIWYLLTSSSEISPHE